MCMYIFYTYILYMHILSFMPRSIYDGASIIPPSIQQVVIRPKSSTTRRSCSACCALNYLQHSMVLLAFSQLSTHSQSCCACFEPEDKLLAVKVTIHCANSDFVETVKVTPNTSCKPSRPNRKHDVHVLECSCCCYCLHELYHQEWLGTCRL